MGRYLNCLPLGKKGMYSIASAATAPIGILQIDVEGYEVYTATTNGQDLG